MQRKLARLEGAVSLDGVSLFDIVPTVTDLLRESVWPLRASWHNTDIMIWDAETGEPLRTLSEHHHPVGGLAFSPDSRRLVSASHDRRLIVWDATTGRGLHTLRGHDGIVNDVAFRPDRLRLASVGEDKVVRLWEAASGREVLSLRGHTNHCRSVAFSPDGRRLASAGWDATIRLWDATPCAGTKIREFSPSASTTVKSVPWRSAPMARG
jgi:WD40 repeat protein